MAHEAEPSPTFLVPDDRMALLVRNGLSLGLFPPGLHHLPSGRVEARLVKPASADRSLLFIDGELVAVRETAGEAGPAIHAWEGGIPENPWRRFREDRPKDRPRTRGAGWLESSPLSILSLSARSR